MKRTIDIYTDGGVGDYCKWGFIVVKDNKLIYKLIGQFDKSGEHNADVEKAEGIALFEAIKYVENNPNNYTIWTDSRSYLDKIQGKIGNKSGSTEFKYIQKVLTSVNNSPLPISCDTKWKARRSNAWMKEIDDLVEIN